MNFLEKNIRLLITLTILMLFADTLFADKYIKVFSGQELVVYPRTRNSSSGFSVIKQYIAKKSDFKPYSVVNMSPGIVTLGLRNNDSKTRLVRRSKLLKKCKDLRSLQVKCEINSLVKILKESNDTHFNNQSALKKISADIAWEKATGSKSVKVAVLGSGVDYTHSDLSNNIELNLKEIPNNFIDDDNNGYIDDYYGMDLFNKDPNPMDDNQGGYGDTIQAGIIGAVGNNSRGVSGVSWEVGLIPVKIFKNTGESTISTFVAGIDYAVARGAHIISLNGYTAYYSELMYQTIQRAGSAGTILIAGAGEELQNNDNPSGDNFKYPASFDLPNIISVASSTADDKLQVTASYGPVSVDLAAPRYCYSTDVSEQYVAGIGNQVSVAFVSGAAALLKSAKMSLTMQQVKELILSNVDKSAAFEGKLSSGGRLNLAKALDAGLALPDPTPVVSPTSAPQEKALSLLRVNPSYKKKRASVKVIAENSDKIALHDVSVTFSCNKKPISTKNTNTKGEAVFSYKMTASSAKCDVKAVKNNIKVSKKFTLKIKK